MAVILCWILELLVAVVRICSSSCGGQLEGASGELRFPISRGKIGELMLCEWTITVPETYRIKITFTDFVMKTTCCSCIHDFLEVRDGPSHNSTLIGRFCAKSEPKNVFSTKSVIWLQFVSNFRTYRRNRFGLSYTAICGSHYTDLSGNFRSPGYPFPYKNNQDCTYTIEVPKGRIKVNFERFNVQGRMPICLYDFLEVKETRYVELLSLQRQTPSRRYCGNEKLPFIYSTRGSYLWFRFHSDDSRAATGFVANYRTISVGEGTCGGTLRDHFGFVYSLNYPFDFPPNQECTWKIQVASDMHVYLYFDTLDFGINSGNCVNGFVEVYDGFSASSKKIGQYCGDVLPPQIISRTNQLLVKAVTFGADKTGWFSLRYTSLVGGVCGLQKFTCVNRQCIENHLTCDGKEDCKDGSDERDCSDSEGGGFVSWYRFWPVSVVGGVLIISIWLWRAWKKVLSSRSEVGGPCSCSPSSGCIEMEPQTAITEPPSYSEAVAQDVRPPPSYDEVVRYQGLPSNVSSIEGGNSEFNEPDSASNDNTDSARPLDCNRRESSPVIVHGMVVSSDSHRSRERVEHSQADPV